MRFAIFGDVHANLQALEAVLADARGQQCTSHVCTGDVVGYNASPRECIAIIRALNCPVVQGNHDEEAAGMSGPKFNPHAREAILWTRKQLHEEEKGWLRGLPLRWDVGRFSAVHASLDMPHKWQYVFSQLDAATCFSYQDADLCFIGHTHVPKAYARDRGVKSLALDRLVLERKKKYLINVGSVGQPRDGDWRAAYCVYDTDLGEVELRRVEYDLVGTIAALREAGLSD